MTAACKWLEGGATPLSAADREFPGSKPRWERGPASDPDLKPGLGPGLGLKGVYVVPLWWPGRGCNTT